MLLRWSLCILALNVSLSTVVLGVPVPNPNDTKTKFPILKETSANYRANAASNPHQIYRKDDGTWTRKENAGARGAQPGEHADHMLEAQTVHAALKAQGKAFHRLSETQREELSGLFNHKDNMQFVNGGTNIRKGALTKAGLKGNAPKQPHADRDGYTQATVAPAAHVAKKIDDWMRKQPGMKANVLDTHLNAMESAGMHTGTLRKDLAHNPQGNQHAHTNPPSTGHHTPGAPGPSTSHHGSTTHHGSAAPPHPPAHHPHNAAASSSSTHAHAQGVPHPPQQHQGPTTRSRLPDRTKKPGKA